jgi:hypothetical protein
MLHLSSLPTSLSPRRMHLLLISASTAARHRCPDRFVHGRGPWRRARIIESPSRGTDGRTAGVRGASDLVTITSVLRRNRLARLRDCLSPQSSPSHVSVSRFILSRRSSILHVQLHAMLRAMLHALLALPQGARVKWPDGRFVPRCAVHASCMVFRESEVTRSHAFEFDERINFRTSGPAANSSGFQGGNWLRS